MRPHCIFVIALFGLLAACGGGPIHLAGSPDDTRLLAQYGAAVWGAAMP
jgi:hypothetical protein